MSRKSIFAKGPISLKIQEDTNEFIESAGKIPSSLSIDHYPWEDLDDKKRREIFNIRFTDVEKEMLKYIDQQTKDSMHAFCISVLRAAILKRIYELTGVEFKKDIGIKNK